MLVVVNKVLRLRLVAQQRVYLGLIALGGRGCVGGTGERDAGGSTERFVWRQRCRRLGSKALR